MLQEEEILQQLGQEWQVVQLPIKSYPQAELQQYPSAAAELTLLERCGTNLAEVLRGECDQPNHFAGST